jgi:hypothetical protein
MAAVAKLIRRHLPNLLTYLRHGLTNTGLEAVDAVIQWVKKIARASATPNISRSPSTSTVEASISTHTKAGRASFLCASISISRTETQVSWGRQGRSKPYVEAPG